MPDICSKCNVTDDEDHRINFCMRWENQNQANDLEKCNFSDIFSSDKNTLEPVVSCIERIWEFRYANGRMRKLFD